MVAAALIGSAVVGGVASSAAGRTQAAAAGRATDSQERMFNTVNEQQRPWREAGERSLGDIMSQFGPEGYFNHQFDANDLNDHLAPNYEFMREQGSSAVANHANAMGGLGGNSLTAISKWNNDYAQNAYQQAFQNYNAQRGDIFNRLASIAGLGQTAGSNATTGASTFAGNIANSQIGAGNATAAGYVGTGNAITGAANNYMGWNYLNRISGGSGNVGGGP